LVNREINAAAEDAQRRVQNACSKFLSLSITALPALPLHAGDFVAGMNNRGPRVWEEPNSAFARATLWMGRAVSDALAGDTQNDLETFGRSDVRASASSARAQQAETRAQQLDPVEAFIQATDRIAAH
jgi:hypothetical protein